MSLLRRIEPFLYSRRNIAGSLLAVAGLGLYFLGIVTGPIWLPIVAGLYAIGYLLVPGQPAVDLGFGATQDAGQIRAGLEKLLRSIKGRIADDLYARVVSIRDSILVTLPPNGEPKDATDPNIRLIRQTALDYLPAALSAYLALPRAYAEGRRVAGGRTPHDVLLDQLELMDRKMQEVAEDIVRQDSDRLLAHGRFLAERFAPSALQLDADTTATPAPTAPPAEPSATATTEGVPAEVEQATPEAAVERERVH